MFNGADGINSVRCGKACFSTGASSLRVLWCPAHTVPQQLQWKRGMGMERTEIRRCERMDKFLKLESCFSSVHGQEKSGSTVQLMYKG